MPAPEVFGLNDNADITKDLGEVSLMLETVLITQSSSGGGGGGKSADEMLLDMAKDIANKLRLAAAKTKAKEAAALKKSSKPGIAAAAVSVTVDP